VNSSVRACSVSPCSFFSFWLLPSNLPLLSRTKPSIFPSGIPAGDTCSTCHKAIYDQWKASPHGANGVECTVCHGEPTSPDFAGMPALSTCDTCHTDQVAQLKSDPFMKGKTCVSCHQAHTFVEHKKAAPAGK